MNIIMLMSVLNKDSGGLAAWYLIGYGDDEDDSNVDGRANGDSGGDDMNSILFLPGPRSCGDNVHSWGVESRAERTTVSYIKINEMRCTAHQIVRAQQSSGTVIRATKPYNLSRNIFALQVAEPKYCSYYHPKFCCATLLDEVEALSTLCNK